MMFKTRFGWGALLLMGALSACSSYPTEPRYSIYADQRAAPVGMPPPGPNEVPTNVGTAPYAPPVATYEDGAVVPPTPSDGEAAAPVRAPTEAIQGGALDAPSNAVAQPAPEETPATAPVPAASASPRLPAQPAADQPAANASASATAVAYEIQPGDTISGVGRRFQVPVQVLVDLNNLGPQAAIAAGQRIRLPASAVDTGPETHARGASPVGVLVAESGSVPPPPPPPSGNRAMPAREPAATARPAATADGTLRLAWPVRGEILRRFGPVGLGERNNGINIAGEDGAEVRASAAGQVGYVGDDIGGQGLTVLVAHRGGWRTVYSHLGRARVRDGDRVEAGQVIGTVGNTAGDGQPSIHFETWQVRGDTPSAVDPLTVLPR